MLGDVLRGLDRVVHVVQAVGHSHRGGEPDRNGQQPRPAARGRDGGPWHFGAVDDPDVVRAAVARDTELVGALQQRFVHRAVAARLALHHVVADALPAQVLRVVLGFFEPRRERAFLEPRPLVLVLYRLQRLGRLEIELALRVGQLRVDAEHLGVPLAVLLGELCLLALEVGQLQLAGLDLRVLRDDRNRVGRRARRHRSDLIVLGLLLDSHRAGAQHGVVQRVQPGDDNVVLVVERHGVLAVAIVGELAFAVLDFLLLRRHFLLEPVEHVLCALELDLEILRHVLVDEGVDGRCGQVGTRGGERDVHQPAVGHRDDLDAREKRADERGFVRGLVRFWHLGLGLGPGRARQAHDAIDRVPDEHRGR